MPTNTPVPQPSNTPAAGATATATTGAQATATNTSVAATTATNTTVVVLSQPTASPTGQVGGVTQPLPTATTAPVSAALPETGPGPSSPPALPGGAPPEVLPATGVMDTRFTLLAALMGFAGALLLVGLGLRGRKSSTEDQQS